MGEFGWKRFRRRSPLPVRLKSFWLKPGCFPICGRAAFLFHRGELSVGSLSSANNRISSIATLIVTFKETANTPGIGRPFATRSYAKAVSVLTSWVSKTRPSVAAHSSTAGSPAPSNPASCTRAMSADGRRRKTPLTMCMLKFSSTAKVNISAIFLNVSQAGERGCLFVENASHFRLGFARLQLRAGKDRHQPRLVMQVIADDRVYISQLQAG